jgi:transcriptional regulator with XRE-family HTH domain
MRPVRSSDHLALGVAVRDLRRFQGFSQESLGLACGVHRNYVGAIERGELNPTYGVLLRLCVGLAVAPSQLLSLAERRAADPSRAAGASASRRARALVAPTAG